MKPRPKTSPYASTLLEIEFNEAESLSYVPKVFLQDQSWVSEESDYYACNCSEEVGHVLIHYLFTGEYQILEIDETKVSQDKSWAELRIATQVLLALDEWKLPGLQGLVQSEIESLSKSIHIFDVVRLIDKELNGFAIKQELWLKNFLVNSLNTAFAKNSKEFEDLSLLDKLHNIDLIKFLAKNLFKTYHSRISKPLRRKGTEERRKDSQDTDSVSAVTLTPESTSDDEFETSPKIKTSKIKSIGGFGIEPTLIGIKDKNDSVSSLNYVRINKSSISNSKDIHDQASSSFGLSKHPDLFCNGEDNLESFDFSLSRSFKSNLIGPYAKSERRSYHNADPSFEPW
ncbi:hypothetical protein OnM2_023012 [Erysiphe neolycopersici]|uniref:Uncharacterized protein n=1 Tax=Erysiphe neolycopersici TaxID=212602 RepID=A0A420I2F1_9PEZI|nr:hypothetical protein OnM2_023012 [Erysiphe neolycopersici]